MSVSRSLVGSSSSSTLGSPASSRSSCSRRRSPPERSPTGVQSRRSVKPNTSASCAAESSRSPSSTRRATSSTASSTRRSPGQLGQLLGQERGPHGRAGDRAARRRAWLTPASSRSSVVLPAPLAPSDGDPVAGADLPGQVAQDRLRAGVQRRRPPGRTPACRAGRWPAAAATPCRGPAARRRSARWRRRCGTSAWRCGPAGRGAARRSPCGAGSAGGPRWRRRPARRSARARVQAA